MTDRPRVSVRREEGSEDGVPTGDKSDLWGCRRKTHWRLTQWVLSKTTAYRRRRSTEEVTENLESVKTPGLCAHCTMV